MSWELFIVRGDKEAVRGFIHGFAWGAGDPQAALCEGDIDLERESLGSFLKLGPHHRVFVRQSLADKLAKALEATPPELELEVKKRQPVGELYFEAEARVFSREAAAAIRQRWFEELPPGIQIRNRKEKQVTDASGKGLELYAPVHDFEYHARCTFAGPLEAILDLHREFSTMDFVEVGPLHLD